MKADRLIAEHMARFDRGDRTPEMWSRLCAFIRWMEHGQCVIRDARAALVPLKPNRCQRELLAIMLTQAASERPIRIVALKARKVGVSTLVSALFYFMCGHYQNQRALLLAHEEQSTKRIFDIVKTLNKSYRLIGGEEGASNLQCPDTQSVFYAYTAGGRGFGVGQTPSLVHLSEVDLWPSGTQRENYAAVADSLPPVAETVLVAESTCNGRGHFWELFQQGQDPESWYESHFTPWYFLEGALAPSDNVLSLTGDEARIAERARRDGIKLTKEHFAWRRAKRLEIGELAFKRQFPSCPEEVVEAATGLVVPGLRDCLIEEHELPFDVTRVEDRDRFGGFDAGYNDPTVLLHAVVHDDVTYVMGIYRRSEGLAADHGEAIVPGTTYYSDPSASTVIAELNQLSSDGNLRASFQAAPRPKSEAFPDTVEHQWNTVRTVVAEDRLKIVDTPTTRQLVTESEAFQFDEKTGKPKYTRSALHRHFDSMDALRYLLVGLRGHHDDWGGVLIPLARRPYATRREQIRAF